jgi:hypothetical protein
MMQASTCVLHEYIGSSLLFSSLLSLNYYIFVIHYIDNHSRPTILINYDLILIIEKSGRIM